MDEGSAAAVRVAFDRLYRDGLAYRTEALVNWCPGCRTSVTDLEVIPTAGDRHAVVGPLPPHRRGDRRARSRTATITVATTRPETILGDTAVAVHPDDERYRALVGRTGAHPVRRARRADHRRRRRRARVRDGRGQDHPGPRPRRPRDRAAPRPARADDPRRRRDDHRHRDGRTTASTATRRARGSWPTSPSAATSPASGPRDGRRPLPAQRRRHRAAAQDPVVHPDRRRSPRGPSTRPAAGARGSCPSASRRPGSTG